MSGNNGPVDTQSSFKVSPELMNKINAGVFGDGGLEGLTNAFRSQADTAANSMKTDFNQYVPTLNTDFQKFNPTIGLDQQSQALVAQGQGKLASQNEARNAAIAQQFRGNPGLLGVMRNQNNAQNMLAGNDLGFQAAQQQQARQAQVYQFNQQAQGLSNDSLLNQAAARAAGQSQTNAALNSQLNMRNTGLTAQQNLMNTLGEYAKLTGKQITERTPNQIQADAEQARADAASRNARWL